jgi:hypothetical protein
MVPQPVLSQSEWELVIELLEKERGELPVEVRHTRTSNVREELRAREQTIDQLLERLRSQAGT